jgi:hypothetical protein
VRIGNSSNTTIGGTSAGARNVISGNDANGVFISGTSSASNKVEDNLIGTNVNGTSDLGNAEVGVLVQTPDNFVGGAASGARNVISGNAGVGVLMLGSGAGGNTVQGNLIGTEVDGATSLPNFHGVFISDAGDNTTGATVSAAANTISGNAHHGVNHGVIIIGDTATGNRVLRNSIFGNIQLGIELDNDGVTLNDRKDSDPGPKKLQNFPVLSSASTTKIEGKLDSRPKKTFTIQFFFNLAPNFPTSFGEGETFLGEKTVRANKKGKASFAFAAALTAGEFVTATATDASGNTSEFSAAREVQE